MADSTAPVLSFPSILRNPGLNSRYAHLHGPAPPSNLHKQGQSQVKKRQRELNEGKRWVRRKDNSHFVGNPHIVSATRRDYGPLPPQTQPTFPEPLPSYLPRSVKAPTALLPMTDPASANAGRFSVSLRGMRRDLRRAGGKAEGIVRDVEAEIVQWLTIGGTVLAPDRSDTARQTAGAPIGTSGAIVEVSRTPLQLVWRISDDAFARYIVHCCARYHEVVSFSKGTDENRLTYLLRPNVTHPDRRIPAGLDTPPITDLDYSSNPDSDIDSDFVSDREIESDIEPDHNTALASTAESPTPNSPSLPPVQEDAWSLIDEHGGYSDPDDFESGSEFGSLEASVDVLQPQLQNLSLGPTANLAIISDAQVSVQHQTTPAEDDPDKTLNVIRANPLQPDSPRREWTSVRSASSPSRSPARPRRPRRRAGAKKRGIAGSGKGRSFYEYLFM